MRPSSPTDTLTHTTHEERCIAPRTCDTSQTVLMEAVRRQHRYQVSPTIPLLHCRLMTLSKQLCCDAQHDLWWRRLVVGAYDFDNGRLIGTSCSQPILMCSNNDAPDRAASLAIHIPVSSTWPRWQQVPQQVPFPARPLSWRNPLVCEGCHCAECLWRIVWHSSHTGCMWSCQLLLLSKGKIGWRVMRL